MLTPDPAHRVLLPPSSLGVIGGGQLGRMFIQAAQRMGYRAGTLTPSADSPAAQVADWTVVAPPGHLPALKSFANQAEGVTVEFENVSAPALRWLAKRLTVRPGWKTVRVSQNRLREKGFLKKHGLPHALWRPVRTHDELVEAVETLGTPLILKTADSGYDGKGQIRLDRADYAETAWAGLGRVACVAEGWVDFESEVSVVVARGYDGRAVTYPVAMNRHERHILDSTLMPAPVGPSVSQEAARLALKVAEALGTAGVLTVEFFLKADGELIINELAPRPHNSGHLTIEAAVTSQFEQQVRALCGLPLGAADLLVNGGAMVNLLGDLWKPEEPNWAATLLADPGVKLHLYGKGRPLPGRKMGHLTVVDRDPRQALRRAIAARDLLVQHPKS